MREKDRERIFGQNQLSAGLLIVKCVYCLVIFTCIVDLDCMRLSAKTWPDHGMHFPVAVDCLNRKWRKMLAKIPSQYRCRPDRKRTMLAVMAPSCHLLQCQILFVAVAQDHPGNSERRNAKWEIWWWRQCATAIESVTIYLPVFVALVDAYVSHCQVEIIS